MITFNRMGSFGRIGNQMFQYALIYSVARHLNVYAGIPLVNRSQDEFKDFCLTDGFELSAEDSSQHTPLHKFSEKQFSFNPSVFEVQDNTDFKGWFQSEMYFNRYKNEIKQEFKFKPQIIEKAKKNLSNYNRPLVSVCVRRPQPLETRDSRMHPVCRESYYRACLQQFPDCQKLIFTDDPQWVRKRFDNVDIVPQSNDAINKFIMLKMMSMCDHHIISNSTFCWWGAWLGHNDKKKVLAPSNWFGPGTGYSKEDYKDIYCKNWIVINNDPKITVL